MVSRYKKARDFPEKDFDILNKAVVSPAMTANTILIPVIFNVTRSPLNKGPGISLPPSKPKIKCGI
jgi:hypothetical protein